MKKINRIVIYPLLMASVFALYWFELRYITKTYEAFDLIWKSALISSLIGLAVAMYMNKDTKDWLLKIKQAGVIMICAAAVGPLLGSASNRMWSSDTPKRQHYKIFDPDHRLDQVLNSEKMDHDKEPITIFFERAKQIEKLKIAPKNLEIKDSNIYLTEKEGFWNYHYILI